jgi:hypothetical protein
LIDTPGQAGDLASGFVFVDHAFGSGLLQNGNGLGQAFLGLLGGIAGHGAFDCFHHVFGSRFVVLISDAPHFALPSAL